MWSGVVPQQPPTMLTPFSATNSRSVSAIGPGCIGYVARPPSLIGSPALGMQWIGVLAFCVSQRTLSRIRSGPVEQLRPMMSTRIASRVASAPRMSVPSSMRPEGSSVTEH
jgi:hypothetical protein